MDEEKKFVPPVAEIVDFTNDDIITLSGGDRALNWNEGDCPGIQAAPRIRPAILHRPDCP